MKGSLFYLPAPRTDFVELAKSSKGTLFRKRILKFGSFAHPNLPGEKLVIDDKVAESLVSNFNAGIADIVQLPIVDGDNKHSEDPTRNGGEIVDLQVQKTGDPDKDGVYAVVDARRPDVVEGLRNKTLIGASAMMHMNYSDTSTGKKVGPTLLHVAITNRPYITGLGDFEEFVAASADTSGERPVVLSEVEDTKMELDELLETLKNEHGIDVPALQAAASVQTDALVNAMSGVLREAGAVSLSKTDEEAITVEDVAAAVIEVAQDKVALSQQVEALTADAEKRRRAEAEREVSALVKAGRILPKGKDAWVEIALSNREQFEAMLPEDAIVSLTEEGVTTTEPSNGLDGEALQSEVTRLAGVAAQMNPKGRRARRYGATSAS